MLHALSENMPAEKFGRVHHLPTDRLARVVDGMRARGLIDASGWLSDAGRETKAQIESLTDELATPEFIGRRRIIWVYVVASGLWLAGQISGAVSLIAGRFFQVVASLILGGADPV